MSFLGHIERGTRIMSLETFVNICGELGAGSDELLWGVTRSADVSGLAHDVWDVSDQKTGRVTDEKVKNADSYAMYVRIMKSVAEIMNDAKG